MTSALVIPVYRLTVSSPDGAVTAAGAERKLFPFFDFAMSLVMMLSNYYYNSVCVNCVYIKIIIINFQYKESDW